MDPSFFVSWMKHDVTKAIPLQGRHMMVCVGCLPSVSGSILPKSIFGNNCNANLWDWDVIINEETVDGELFSSYIEQTILPLLQPSSGSNQFWVWTNAFIRYLPPPHSASCPSASTVFAPVTECKTTTSVSFNRWYHHVCKWSICISGWMKIHHYCNHQHIVSCNGWIIDIEEVIHIIHRRGSLVWFLSPIVRTLTSVLEFLFPGT